MNTLRSHETMFEGDDLGEAQALELDTPTRTSTRTSTPTSTWTSASTPTPTWTSPPTFTSYVPPVRRVPSNAIAAAMSEIPMSIWKRLAVYPFALWAIVYMILPCRLSGRSTLIMFALGAVGIVGAWIRYRAHDRFLSPFE
jgi:hypothetical protein